MHSSKYSSSSSSDSGSGTDGSAAKALMKDALLRSGVSSQTLRLQIMIVQKIFEDINIIIQDSSKVDDKRKIQLAQFARLLDKINSQASSDDPTFLAKELNQKTWESALEFYNEMMKWNKPEWTNAQSNIQEYHRYMNTYADSGKKPPTLEELRVHHRKDTEVDGDQVNDPEDNDKALGDPEDNHNTAGGHGLSGQLEEDNFLTFGVAEKTDECIDLNWKRLRNMAQPIVDRNLANLVLNQSWKTTPLQLSLGSLMVNNKLVPVERRTYNNSLLFGDEPEDTMMDLEIRWKHGGRRPGWIVDDFENQRKKAKIEKLKEADLRVLCIKCDNSPCAWLRMREELMDKHQMDYDHLCEGAHPPNIIRRMSIYRYFVRYMNNNGRGKAAGEKLPQCVVDGVQNIYPNPVFDKF